jgi:hypothetical protein
MPIDTVRSSTSQPARPPAATGAQHASPPASRFDLPRWFDLRLLIGAVLVLSSIALGARVIAAADHTVPVLVAAEDLAIGQPLTPDLVETRQVQLSEAGELYHTGVVGEGYVAVRPVSRGELLPRAAVGRASDVGEARYVTLPLPGPEAPAGLQSGNQVEVWLLPAAEADDEPATRLLPNVSVTAVAGASGTFGDTGGDLRVTLAITGEDEALTETTATLVEASRTSRIYLTKLPDAAS